MTVSEEITAIDKKMEQNKAQWKLERQTAKISAFSPENVGKYEFLTDEDVLPEKKLLQKSCYNQKIWIFTIE